MAIEGPITSTVVSHAQDAKTQTAAMLMLMGLALWIESPVIDLLATSTTLSKNPRDFARISRFVWQLMGWCTAVHVLIAFTPLYDVVTLRLMDLPPNVAEAGRIPLQVMIPWSACIGWRRYLQGVLIRFGRTRVIGFGTAVRVSTMAGTCFALFRLTTLTGVEICAVALIASVFAEMTVVHLASRDVVRRHLRTSEDSPLGDLNTAKLLKFHLPLTATTLVFMLSIPITTAAIARAPDQIVALAAWQVATGIIFLHRTVVFALPEPVIALYRGPETRPALEKLCLTIGAAASGFMLLFFAFGLEKLYFARILGAAPEVVSAATVAYILCVALPLIGSAQSFFRAMLTAHHVTVARFGAVITSTAVLVALLAIGVALQLPGVWTASVALTGSTLAELIVLGSSWRKARARFEAA